MTFNSSYLYTPSSSEIMLPIESKRDILPIDQLKWEDFERLCLRLAQAHYGKSNCEVYGTKGQKQEGIDIFAHKSVKYASYQCKRYQTVTENDLEEAVNTFKKGEWFGKSDEFFFCTSCTLEKTQIQEKFLELKNKLIAHDIDFIKWDKIQISLMLKEYPQIVYDFFGREWVKAFNGEEFLNNISREMKLDAVQIAEYRKKLFNVYATIFQKYDPSIPAIKFGNHTINIQDRFIVPDFIEKRTTHQYHRIEDIEQSEYEGREFRDKDSQQIKPESLSFVDYESEVRLNLDDNLATSDRLMILGEPGSGKSTLLRYLVLDLLSEEPQLLNTAKQWGRLLPVWLPFAFITKKLYENENLNLAELLRLWLNSIGEETLFALMNDALNDERLLLIVDGVDEWTNSEVAKLAISKIEIQSSMKKTKIIYSSRPYGYRLQKDYFQELKIYTIAEFSINQQKQFISYWYKKWMEHQSRDEINFVRTETNQFLSELQQSKDLLKLASNPLLLSILISHRFENATLPKNKVRLLSSITEYLIKKHPIKRRTSANISDESEQDFDIADIYTVLAKNIHQKYHDGIILKDDACKVIQDYLQEEMGYEKPRAKKVSQDILNIAANNIGIIIEKSPDEIAFIHRQFQEFMTAKFLIDSDATVIKQMLREYAHDPQWNPVILFFFGLIPPRRKQDFIEYISILEEKSVELGYTKLLTYSLGLTLNNAPITITNRYLIELIEEFEYETHPSKKEALWNVLLSALYNPKINEDVFTYLFKYFPNRYKYTDKRLETLEYLSIDKLTSSIKQFIIKSIINGNRHQKLEASKQARQFITDPWVFDKIVKTLNVCYNPEIIGYLINTLISDKVEKTIKEDIIRKYEFSEHSEISLFVIKLKVHMCTHSSDDLDELIAKQKDITYTLYDEVEQTLISGWSNSEELYQYLMESLEKSVTNTTISHEHAWSILFKCFNQREKVVDRVVHQIENEEYPFLNIHRNDQWELIADNFRDNTRLIPVIENWLKRADKHDVIETAYACLIGRTEENKNYLLEQLTESSFSHWQLMALTSGWPDNKNVKDKLKIYFRSNNKRRDYSAGYISSIFADDKDEGIRILEDILFNRELRERNRALPALIELDREYFEKNVLDQFIENELPLLNKDWGNYYQALQTLINNFNDHTIIKRLAKHNFFKLPAVVLQNYPNMMQDFEIMLSTSMPVADRFRLNLIEVLSHRYFLNNLQVTDKLSLFMEEQNLEIRMASAFIYFENLKDISPDVVLENSNNLVFYSGESHEVQRQIAFGGYLKLGKLEEYFTLEDTITRYTGESKERKLASPKINLSDHQRNGHIIIHLLIEHFDYIFNVIDRDLSRISMFGKTDGYSQSQWGFIAKHSDKDSPSTPYIIDYINKEKDINNFDLIDFLIRTSSDTTDLKQILITNVDNKDEITAIKCGKLLGDIFSDDEEVYSLVNDIKSVHESPGRLMALCRGWPNDQFLKDIVNDLYENKTRFTADLAYTIKFKFGDIDNIINFLQNLFDNYNEALYMHKFFYPLLLQRFQNDEELRTTMKNLLLSTNSISEKVSSYALLEKSDGIDQEVVEWKQKELLSKEAYRFGYNITENKLTSLIEVLDENSYGLTLFN
ncbi:NACHT domain-containing protein [Psychrobacter sp. NPDC064578]|uniref:NACHT domain-containing protein n=1 Tax=Psychrobacter sp. NPDC064578 TaxID=3364493 RepID=UPI00384C5995